MSVRRGQFRCFCNEIRANFGTFNCTSAYWCQDTKKPGTLTPGGVSRFSIFSPGSRIPRGEFSI